MKLNDKYLSMYYEGTTDFPDYKIDLKKTMLLLVDLQNEFCNESMGEAIHFKETNVWDRWQPHYERINKIVIPNCVRVLDFFRKNDIPVSFGRIASLNREDGEDRSPVQKTEGWNGMLLPINSDNAQMVKELTTIINEIVVNKTTDSVTTGTNYLHLLQNMGITTVVVGGLVTDQCVASTVRGLADAGLQVITIDDCCAAPDMNLHDTELKIMNVIYTYVLSTDEALGLLTKHL